MASDKIKKIDPKLLKAQTKAKKKALIEGTKIDKNG